MQQLTFEEFVSDGWSCPECGQDFETEHAMKTHYGRSHDGSISGRVYECDRCGDEFRRVPAEAEAYDHTFCNEDCRNAWQSKNIQGEDHPNWTRITEECSWCGDPVTRYQADIRRKEHVFCDDSCRGSWLSENNTGENHPNWEGKQVETECTYCGDLVMRYRHELESHDPFCNPECLSEWQSENWTGENSPRWRGGDEYGAGWTESKREAVRERDGRECQGCGLPEDEHVKQHGEKLHVHHIIPANSIDDPKRRNAMENLVALCRNCHREWEKMAPLTPVSVSD